MDRPGQSLTFDTDPERVVLQTADGQTIDSRTSPRFAHAGYDLNSPWDALQVGYFLSYGLWNYLTTPFLLTYPGVQTREITPWQENDQTWHRLRATLPPEITTHSAEQIFYFGDDGLLRRLDYTVEADGGQGRALHRGLQDLRRTGLPHPPPGLPPQPRRHPRPQPYRDHARHPRHHRRLNAADEGPHGVPGRVRGRGSRRHA